MTEALSWIVYGMLIFLMLAVGSVGANTRKALKELQHIRDDLKQIRDVASDLERRSRGLEPETLAQKDARLRGLVNK